MAITTIFTNLKGNTIKVVSTTSGTAAGDDTVVVLGEFLPDGTEVSPTNRTDVSVQGGLRGVKFFSDGDEPVTIAGSLVGDIYLETNEDKLYERTEDVGLCVNGTEDDNIVTRSVCVTAGGDDGTFDTENWDFLSDFTGQSPVFNSIIIVDPVPVDGTPTASIDNTDPLIPKLTLGLVTGATGGSRATQIEIYDGAVVEDQSFATGDVIYSEYSGDTQVALDLVFGTERTSEGSRFNRTELDGFTDGQLVIANATILSLEFWNNSSTTIVPAAATLNGDALRVACSDYALSNAQKILEWQILLEGAEFGVRIVNVVGNSFRVVSKTSGEDLSGITLGGTDSFGATLANVNADIPGTPSFYGRTGEDITTLATTTRPSEDPDNWFSFSGGSSAGATAFPDNGLAIGLSGDYQIVTAGAAQITDFTTTNGSLSGFFKILGNGGAVGDTLVSGGSSTFASDGDGGTLILSRTDINGNAIDVQSFVGSTITLTLPNNSTVTVNITAYDGTVGNYPTELPIGDVAILRATWVVTDGNWTIDQLGAIGVEFITNLETTYSKPNDTSRRNLLIRE